MSFRNLGINLHGLLEDRCKGNWGLMSEVLENFMDDEFMKAQGHKPVKAEDWSLLEILHFIAEQQGIPAYQVVVNGQISESVDVTQFPTLTAILVEKQVMAAYNAAPKILDQLVTPFNSSLQTSIIPGAFVKGDLQDIPPGMPYPEDADVEEKTVQIAGGKRGLILNITEEIVMHDQTGLVMLKAQGIGERLAMDRERRGIYTILDVTVNGVNYYAYYPETGNATQTYARVAVFSNAVAGGIHSQDNLIDDALQDYTDLDAAKNALALMTDDNGDPITNVARILLVPVSLETVGGRLLGSSTLTVNWERGMTGSPGEANPYQNKYKLLSSPLLDGISTIQWYLGDFQKQYLEKIVIPMQVQRRRRGEGEGSWKRDIVASFKVRHWTQVGARDYRFVIKSQGNYGVCPSSSYCSTWAD